MIISMASTQKPSLLTALNSTLSEAFHHEIMEQAYQSYLNEGAKDGSDLHHWLDAEDEIKAKYGYSTAAGSKKVSAR